MGLRWDPGNCRGSREGDDGKEINRVQTCGRAALGGTSRPVCQVGARAFNSDDAVDYESPPFQCST
jgi:hypothetical protein